MRVAIYSFSNTSLATVDSNGKVTPVSSAANYSAVTITASYLADANNPFQLCSRLRLVRQLVH